MREITEKNNSMEAAADMLFNYLRNVIYSPINATLDVDRLPEAFRDLGKGLLYFADSVLGMTELAKNLADGNLDCKLPPPGNEIAAPLKSLHASLKHLTWQAREVANGNYNQRVAFMGDFSDAFNNMIKQLERRRKIHLEETTQLKSYVDLMLLNYPDPLLLFDSNKKLIYANDLFINNFNFPEEEEITGKDVRRLLEAAGLDDLTERVDSMYENAARERRTVIIEYNTQSRNKESLRHYQIQIAPMLNTNGTVEGAMLFLNDRTEIINTYREAERAREAESARENAEKTSRAKSDFLAQMSHEIRTPMNAIIGMTAIYKGTNDPMRKEYCIEKISDASKYLLGIINDVLDMSKIEADKFELSYDYCDFSSIVDRTVGIISFKAEERKQRLTVDIDDNIPASILTDDQRLVQVLTNLLSNAVKFTPEGGSVSLHAWKLSENEHTCTIQFAVTDTGIGISEKEQKRLFSPYEQADSNTARRYGGTGLGLTISKRIVEMMRGDMRVESKTGKGSRFVFEITVEKADSSVLAPTRTDGAETDVPLEHEHVSFCGRRILLVDDVEINREVLVALLEDTGVQIDCAEDGFDAIKKLSGSPVLYDLILMDINMPNMDGYETTKRIRASGRPGTETIPIIAMTASVFSEDIERCITSGMNAHLGKPINIDEVIAKIKVFLN